MKVGFDGETYEEAVYAFQKAFTEKIRSILRHLKWDVPDRVLVKMLGKDNWGRDYFHVNFKPIVPTQIIYTPVSSVTLDRKPGKAAERVFTNNSDRETVHTYEHAREDTRRQLSGKMNLQGFEISNKFTIGTGQTASINVQNETQISVKAEVQDSHEDEKTHTDSERDTTQITVAPHTKIRVTQARWETKMKEVDTALINFDVGFEIHNKSTHIADGVYPNDDYKHRGKFARRAMVVRSLSDFHAILRGISPRYPKLRTNLLEDSVVADAFEWMKENTVFRKTEESIFEEASYGEVIVSKVN